MRFASESVVSKKVRKKDHMTVQGADLQRQSDLAAVTRPKLW